MLTLIAVILPWFKGEILVFLLSKFEAVFLGLGIVYSCDSSCQDSPQSIKFIQQTTSQSTINYSLYKLFCLYNIYYIHYPVALQDKVYSCVQFSLPVLLTSECVWVLSTNTSNEKVSIKNRVIRTAIKRTETSTCSWPPAQCSYTCTSLYSPLCCITAQSWLEV